MKYITDHNELTQDQIQQVLDVCDTHNVAFVDLPTINLILGIVPDMPFIKN